MSEHNPDSPTITHLREQAALVGKCLELEALWARERATIAVLIDIMMDADWVMVDLAHHLSGREEFRHVVQALFKRSLKWKEKYQVSLRDPAPAQPIATCDEPTCINYGCPIPPSGHCGSSIWYDARADDDIPANPFPYLEKQGIPSPWDILREALAANAHSTWTGWATWMLLNQDETHVTRETFQLRWKQQMDTPYTGLSRADKEPYRGEADKILSILKEHGWKK